MEQLEQNQKEQVFFDKAIKKFKKAKETNRFTKYAE